MTIKLGVETITTAFFPPESGGSSSLSRGGFQTLSRGGGNDGGGGIKKGVDAAKELIITAPSEPFYARNTYGPLSVAESKNIKTDITQWSCEPRGSMSPREATASYLTIPASPTSGTITVKAMSLDASVTNIFDRFVSTTITYPPEEDDDDDGDDEPIDEFEVYLILGKAELTLMQTNTYTIVVSNITKQVSCSADDYKIEIRRDKNADEIHTMYHGTTDSTKRVERVAGFSNSGLWRM